MYLYSTHFKSIIYLNDCAAQCFCEKDIHFFRLLWWIKSSKEHWLFEIFCNIINISVTFDWYILHPCIHPSIHLNNWIKGLLSPILGNYHPFRSLNYTDKSCHLLKTVPRKLARTVQYQIYKETLQEHY